MIKGIQLEMRLVETLGIYKIHAYIHTYTQTYVYTVIHTHIYICICTYLTPN